MINCLIQMTPLLQVFSSPGAAFASLPERRRAWLLPIICDAILLLLVNILIAHFMGMENVARQQMSGFNLPPDQMEKAVAQAATPARIYIGYVATLLLTPIILMAIAGALTIFSMMTSRQPKFSAMLSMVSISFFPYWLIACVMTGLILMLAPDPGSMDIRNLVASNVGAFMDKNSLPKGLYSLLSSIDILSFAEIGLLGYGFSKLTRVGLFGGIGAVMALWVLYVSSKMALSILF